MLNSYYFKCKGVVLADIKAKTEEKAKQLLPIQHEWIGATTDNSTLVRVESVDTEPYKFGTY
jgi:hypothetical protein